MTKSFFSRRSFLAIGLAATVTIAGCAQIWETAYTPVGDSARNWRVTDVNVTVPSDLTVSESNQGYTPNADIVWQGEPVGDRYAQVAAIVEQGISAGAKDLRGGTPVRFNVVVKKFHALNRLAVANAPLGTGVENIDYDIEVVDARTGAVILPAQNIRAEFEGLTGAVFDEAAAKGESQRDRIVYHIYETTRGWLGTGPDNRRQFARVGA